MVRAKSYISIFLFAFVMASIAIVNTGCSKKPENTSTMKIAMPDWNAVTRAYSSKSQTTQGKDGQVGAFAVGAFAKVTVVTRVMINVSGPDIATKVDIWDLKDQNYKNGDPIPTPPAFVTLDVPRGSDRLFQALAILQEIDTADSDNDGGPMTFLYGDKTQALTKATEDISIALVNQGVAGADDGTITGRWLNTNGTGPTGKLNMYYAPTGRPEMIVDTGYVFSGFFQAFVPSGARFSYRMASGQSLFDQVTTTSLDAALGTALMKVQVPAGYNERASGRSATKPRSKVLGFVGPGAIGKAVCYSNVPAPINNLYTSSTVGDSSRVSWSPASGAVADARVIAGGIGTSDGQCPAGSGDFGDGHLLLKVQSLAYGDSPIGIRGPFQELSDGSNQFLSASLNSGTLTLQWKYLKPVVDDSVAGVGVFTKVYAVGETLNNRWHDSAPCSELTSKYGFTEITRVAAGAPASPVQSYALANVPTAEYTAGRHMTVLCPYSKTSEYYGVALTHFNNGGNNAVAMITAHVPEVNWNGSTYFGFGPQRIEFPASTFTIILEARNSAGNLVPNFNVTDISTAATGIALTNQYGVTPSCGTLTWTSGIGTLNNCTFPNDAYAAGYRVQFRTGGYTTPYPMHTTGDQFFIADPGETYQLNMMSRASSYAAGACQPVLLQHRFNSYLANPAASSSFITLSAGAYTNAFYPDAGCATAPITMASLNFGESAKVVYISLAGGGVPVFSANGFTAIDPFTYMTPAWLATGPYPANEYRFTVSATTAMGSCEPVMITRTDMNGRAIPATANLTLTLSESGSNAQFFSTPNCSGGAIATTILTTGESAALVYVRTMMASGNASLSVVDNDGGGAKTGTVTGLQVSP